MPRRARAQEGLARGFAAMRRRSFAARAGAISIVEIVDLYRAEGPMGDVTNCAMMQMCR
jgi:hypothetical protein